MKILKIIKRILPLPKFILSFIIFHSVTSFSNSIHSSNEIIRCPDEIICTGTTDDLMNIKCDTLIGDEAYKKYMIINKPEYRPTFPGIYTFIRAETKVKHLDDITTPSSAYCKYNYVYSSSRDSVDLMVSTNYYSNLTFVNDQGSHWNEHDMSPELIQSFCYPINGEHIVGKNCPFTVFNGVTINNHIINNDDEKSPTAGNGPNLRFIANINNKIWVRNDKINSLVSFIPDNLIKKSGCTDQCDIKISIGLQDGEGHWIYSDAGGIIVDVNNNMKILQVYSNFPLPDNGRLKIGPNNSVMYTQKL